MSQSAAANPVGLRNEALLLYHATPLHYLPHIWQSGALYAKSILAKQGIAPRPTAVRRDRMLGLADWVHFSLKADTPLLRDKLRKGYPHAVLAFHRQSVLALPGVALLPFNTKAWRSRAVCRPITDSQEKAALLRRHLEAGQSPSLEILVHYGLDLTLLVQTLFVTEEERAWAEILRDSLLPRTAAAPLVTEASLLPADVAYQPLTLPAIAAYFGECLQAGTLLPAPPIPFD